MTDPLVIHHQIVALITAQLSDDQAAASTITADLNRRDLPGLLGSALGIACTLVKIIAQEWDCTPSEAWATIQHASRKTGAP